MTQSSAQPDDISAAPNLAERWKLAVVGAAFGVIGWLLAEWMDLDWFGDRIILALAVLFLTAGGATLAMAGLMGIVRALVRGLALGLVTAGLAVLVSLRFEDTFEVFLKPMNRLALLIVATLPVPFMIIGMQTAWRDYSQLFATTWALIIRFAAAGAFTLLVWMVIALVDQLLQVVGIEVIDGLGRLIHPVFLPFVMTGAVVGLGMAVVYELSDVLSPTLPLRLFRLLLPVVLVVSVIFLVALPLRGFDNLFRALSPTVLLLLLLAGGIALVSIVIDQSDSTAAESPLLRRSAQAMSLILPVVAGLALWAVGLRLNQHGLTPERLFLAVVGVIGFGYALAYAAAVVRGKTWMGHIRRANVFMALTVLVVAALWLTPVLNAERISAQNQLARFLDGRTPVEELDFYALRNWGKPGAEVLARLEAMADEPGQEALASLLAGEPVAPEVSRAELVVRLARSVPVQPAMATGRRDALLAAVDLGMLEYWAEVCDAPSTDGTGSCLMVVADLLPLISGDEALIFLRQSEGFLDVTGVVLNKDGEIDYRMVINSDGSDISQEKAEDLLRRFRLAMPSVTTAPLNQLGTGEDGVIILR